MGQFLDNETVIDDTLTEVALFDVEDNRILACEISVLTNALDQFVISAAIRQGGNYTTLFSTSTDFLSPRGDLLACSGDLTIIGAGSNAFFKLLMEGWAQIRLQAASSNVAGSTVTVKPNIAR